MSDTQKLLHDAYAQLADAHADRDKWKRKADAAEWRLQRIRAVLKNDGWSYSDQFREIASISNEK